MQQQHSVTPARQLSGKAAKPQRVRAVNAKNAGTEKHRRSAVKRWLKIDLPASVQRRFKGVQIPDDVKIEEIPQNQGVETEEHPLDGALGDIHELALILEVNGMTDAALRLAKAYEAIENYILSMPDKAGTDHGDAVTAG